MIKLLRLKTPDRRELAKIANHLFFATAALFVVQHNILQSTPERGTGPMVSQALNLQPRTPPPLPDADQLSGDGVDTTPSGDTGRTALGELADTGLTNMAPSGVPFPTHQPSSGPVLMRSDAPDRYARALPPRQRPE